MRLRGSASAAMCALLLLSVQVRAAGKGGRDSAAATELRVRIFSTQVVKSLSVMPEHATMRLCMACAVTPLTQQLSLTVAPNAGDLLVNGKRSRSAWLDGQLKMTAEGGRTASGAGRWQVSAAADGLHVVLTVPSERYVMAVLASEAAPDEPVESLKALAVVARSFARVTPPRHGLEDLCDSTHCQAMRMERVPARIEAAVQATAGETLWFGGRRVEGYFTQNCGGVAADAAEVWGGSRKAWLVSHGDAYCQRQPSQWHAAVNERQLREAMAAEGWHVPGPLTGFRIVAKDGSGRAVRVELRGGGEPLVMRAASLRFAVNRALGWDTLRSDWYAVQMLGGRVVFEGKGYGHGVGLCQAGAAGMARLGKGYREILGGYFPGALVRVDAGDDGWRQTEGRGWSLRWVRGEPLTQRARMFGAKVAKESNGEDDLVAAGDAALARARGRWGGGAGCGRWSSLRRARSCFGR